MMDDKNTSFHLYLLVYIFFTSSYLWVFLAILFFIAEIFFLGRILAILFFVAELFSIAKIFFHRHLLAILLFSKLFAKIFFAKLLGGL